MGGLVRRPSGGLRPSRAQSARNTGSLSLIRLKILDGGLDYQAKGRIWSSSHHSLSRSDPGSPSRDGQSSKGEA